eukprot:356742-Chlamydomonas_euryale.AAC.1
MHSVASYNDAPLPGCEFRESELIAYHKWGEGSWLPSSQTITSFKQGPPSLCMQQLPESLMMNCSTYTRELPQRQLVGAMHALPYTSA